MFPLALRLCYFLEGCIMALFEDELTIVNLRTLFSNKDIKIPEYQRPYCWSKKSANILFSDTYTAFKDGIEEYRLGSVIFHKSTGDNHNSTGGNPEEYKVVDGQQRLTTLAILFYCLNKRIDSLRKEEADSVKPSQQFIKDGVDSFITNEVNQLSKQAIRDNFRILKMQCAKLSDDELCDYGDYLCQHCKVVQIVTDSEQEAFQFFDSQNNRGKALAPHDLLKAYHLREMQYETESDKEQLIGRFEDIDQNFLARFFEYYLYPLQQWYKKRDGLHYSTKNIAAFKGVKNSNLYNFALYHKASNLFVEHFNGSGDYELVSGEHLSQFQLTQPLIAGRRFFEYIFYYVDLFNSVENEINKSFTNDSMPDQRAGDRYTKCLFESAALFFADRFGSRALNQSALDKFYEWSYSLRVTLDSVYRESINKYAKGEQEKINHGVALFNAMSEMNDPQELNLIILAELPEQNNSKQTKEGKKKGKKQNPDEEIWNHIRSIQAGKER